MPWPPPTHIVSRPNCLSWNCSELISVVAMRAPVMPNGWPTAIAPPLTFSFSSGIAQVAVRRDHLRGERLVDLHQVDVVDGHTGQRQRLLGRLDRAEAHDLRRQARVTPVAHDARERRDAQLLRLRVGHDHQGGRAVVERAAVPGGHAAVRAEHRLEAGDALDGHAGAGPSSELTTRPFGQRDRRDLARPEAVGDRLFRQVLRADAELVHLLAGTFFRPREVLRGLAHRDVGCPARAVRARVVPLESPPWQTATVRASASANTGLWVSGHESELPLANRDTVSTPAEMNTSPSPALMACNAIRVVCRLDAQYLVTVVPGRCVVAQHDGDDAADVEALLTAGQAAAHHQVVDRGRVELRHLVQRGPHDLRGRSSGRMSTRDPLPARPIGERAAETMTASGMAQLLRRAGHGAGLRRDY